MENWKITPSRGYKDEFDKKAMEYVDMNGEWDWIKLNSLLHQQVISNIHSTFPLGPMCDEDRLIWNHHKSGMYTVKSAYSMLSGDLFRTPYGRKFGSGKDPKEYIFYLDGDAQ